MRYPKDWRFPMPCPACDAVTGTPRSVTTSDRVLTVELVCGECRHEWTIAAPTPEMFVKSESPAPDLGVVTLKASGK